MNNNFQILIDIFMVVVFGLMAITTFVCGFINPFHFILCGISCAFLVGLCVELKTLMSDE